MVNNNEDLTYAALAPSAITNNNYELLGSSSETFEPGSNDIPENSNSEEIDDIVIVIPSSEDIEDDDAYEYNILL